MSSNHQSSDRRVNGDEPQIALVAALDEQRVIGRDGQLPWHLPADLRHFKKVTHGHPVVMGRGTYESLGKPLPGRENIVITSRGDFEAPGCTVVHSLGDAIDVVRQLGAEWAMILGGESIFRQFLPQADWLILTVVHGTYSGDTYFPGFVSEDWEVVERKFRAADEKNDAAMTFMRLRAAVDTPRRVEDESGPGPLPDILSDNK